MRHKAERGQSVVLLAGAMVALLVFAGLAVDAGVIYMGSLHLSRSVDAAVLAGVVELPEDDRPGSCNRAFEERTCAADDKALDFLAVNGITYTVDVPLPEFFQSSRESGVIGSYRYRVTATHQVDLYFLPLVNFTHVKLRDMALADYNPWVDIYTDQSGALGKLSTVNQAFKGRDEESARGDAFSPTDSPWYDELQGKYVYRIYVPREYAEDAARVEILDPDDYDSGAGVQETGYYTNPVRFLGLDEGTSGNPIRFTLFYYEQRPDGTLRRVDLAQYTGTAGGDAHGTDLMWVCPGSPRQPPDYGGSGVPTDFGAFEVAWPVEDIHRSDRGDAYVYMEAQSLGRHEENGFDLWAGPWYPDLPGDVNDRNEAIGVAGGAVHDPRGVIVYAVGHLAYNSNARNRVEMQLADIPSAWAGRKVRIDYFDIDTRTYPPFIFYFDTIPQKDWAVCYDDAPDCTTPAGRLPCESTAELCDMPPGSGAWQPCCQDTEVYGYQCADFGLAREGRAWVIGPGCSGEVSNNRWRTYEFVLPPKEVFYGGRLKVSYGGGEKDNVTFRMMVESVPRLLQ